jgi:putative hemolysin
MSVWLELSVIVGLILLNGLLAMSELAIISSKKGRLKKLSDDGHKGARIALQLTESNTNDFLASIQVGITCIGVLAGAFSGATLSEKISAFLKSISPRFEPYSEAIGLASVVIFVTYLSLILGELVPKKLALNNPEALAAKVSRFIAFLGRALSPIVYLLSGSTRVVLKLLGAAEASDKTVTEEEIKNLIEEGTEAGVFDKQEETMMKKVLRLDDYKVENIMTPRMKIFAVDINDSLENILEKVIQSGHSYFPVFDKTLDRPLGLFSLKSILVKLVKKEVIDIRDCLSSALFFPESLPVDAALERFRESGKHIALVVDEHGGFAGLITVYDISEAIMGEIPKNDQSFDRKIVKRQDGSLLVEGHMDFEELTEYLHLKNQNDNDFQTVGGFIMANLGRIPTEGDVVFLGNYRLEVVDMDRRRVDKVLIEDRYKYIGNALKDG